MPDDVQRLSSPQTPKILVFPMPHRIGIIRDVASKMLEKTTPRHSSHYRKQVSDGLISHFGRISLTPEEQEEQLAAFWEAVEREMRRQIFGFGSRPGGAA